MRHRKRLLAAPVKSNLTVRFTAQGLTSYSGLELFREFLHVAHFSDRLRRHLRTCDPAGDYASVGMVRLVVALLVVGASRLRHVRYVVGDPLIHRFAGLRSVPSERTLSRWLCRCSAPVRAALRPLRTHSPEALGHKFHAPPSHSPQRLLVVKDWGLVASSPMSSSLTLLRKVAKFIA